MIVLLPSSGMLGRDSTRSAFLRASMLMWLGEVTALEVARDYDEMTDRIRGGEVALAWAPPAVCARVEGQVRGIYRSIREGRSHYHAALLVRRDDVEGLAGLAGRRAAWVDPLSSGGHLLAVRHLASVAPDLQLGAGYFAGTYRQALLDVAEGRADVTSLYSHSTEAQETLDTARELIGSAARQLAVLSYTPPTPNDGLVLTRALSDAQCESVGERIRQAPPDVLLQALQVEALTLATPDAYRALR